MSDVSSGRGRRPKEILRSAADAIGRLSRGSGRRGSVWTLPRADSVTGTGGREYQQDSFAFSGVRDSGGAVFAAALCDGMGGMADGGEIAEETAKKALRLCFSGGDCREGIIRLSREIYEKYGGEGGTTLVMVRIRNGVLEFWSVGDSDIRLLRHGRLYRLNSRHTHQNELYRLAAAGRIGAEEARDSARRHALSQYIGAKSVSPEQFVRSFLLCRGDTLLLCSDGVSDTLNDRQLARLMALSPESCCEGIGREIEAAGLPGQDNYSAVAIRI